MSPKCIALQRSSQNSTPACHLSRCFIAGGSDNSPISRSQNTVHILALCWVHSVIGWGFFILQSWIPTYLNHLGMTDLKTVGLLSALPWLVRHTPTFCPIGLFHHCPFPSLSIAAHCCPLPLLPILPIVALSHRCPLLHIVALCPDGLQPASMGHAIIGCISLPHHPLSSLLSSIAGVGLVMC